MRVGSTFTGIGGFDLGLERSGMEIAWQCENDKPCSELLKRKWPHVPNHGDIRNVTKETAEPVDIICGGFPCQDLSVAGKREGLAGKRSGLWFEFARVIDELKPKWVVIENVPGLLSSNEGRDFATIIHWLAECGYGVAWRILDSQYFGVAQRRRRVFIVGHLGDGRAAQVLFESESLLRDPRESQAQGKIAPPLTGTGVGAGRTENERNEVDFLIPDLPVYSIHQNAIGREPENGPQRGDYLENISPTLDNQSRSHAIAMMNQGTVGALQERDAKGIGTTIDDKLIAFTLDGDGNDASEDISPTLEHGADGKEGHQSYKKKAIAFNHGVGQFGFAVSEDQTPTIRGSKGGNAVPAIGRMNYGLRRLTPVECERLQGFPDEWTSMGLKTIMGNKQRRLPIWIQADSVRYRQLGNAVTVPVIEWIGKRIMEVCR